MATLVLVTAGPALGQGWGRRDGGLGKGGGPGPGAPVPTRQAGPGRADAPPGPRPGERMSPEERRDLRRDIEQHGREIYPNPQRGPQR